MLKSMPNHPTHRSIYQPKYKQIQIFIRQGKKNNKRKYEKIMERLSKLNHKTPTNKVWDMVRKITGKTVFPSMKHLIKDGNNITEVNEIANVLANNIVKNSSTENYSEKFKRHTIKAEHTALDSNTNNGGRRSPAVACWASDHCVASSNPLRGKFGH